MHIPICARALHFWSRTAEFEDVEIRDLKASQILRLDAQGRCHSRGLCTFANPFKIGPVFTEYVDRQPKRPGVL